MHELGIVLEIFELLEEIMEEQKLKKVSSVTLEVGELSGILPDFFKECWSAARLGSDAFGDTELIIEFKPAIAKCRCGYEYDFMFCGSFIFGIRRRCNNKPKGKGLLRKCQNL